MNRVTLFLYADNHGFMVMFDRCGSRLDDYRICDSRLPHLALMITASVDGDSLSLYLEVFFFFVLQPFREGIDKLSFRMIMDNGR